jgi:hypothetical protein
VIVIKVGAVPERRIKTRSDSLKISEDTKTLRSANRRTQKA